MDTDTETAAEIVHTGGVGIFPTDTIYGLVGSALLPETIDRIYDLKQRDTRKQLLVLISEISDLEQFGVILSEELIGELKSYWPGPYSIVLPIIDEQFEYLHRGHDTIAFRLPDNDELINLLRDTGPLVAPSANPEGMPPAKNLDEARRYFGTSIDFYVDGGELNNKPSTILRLGDDGIEIVRE